jgi:hypothetical protein
VTVFSWDDIQNREDALFPGVKTALTVGGFDGPHQGHERLFSSVLAQDGLLPGIITFSRSPRAFPEIKGGAGTELDELSRRAPEFGGDVSTLMLRLMSFRQRGFAFAVVIDFSQEFSKLSGEIFLNMLARICAMQYIAVGPDFRCGYRLGTGTRELLAFAEAHAVQAEILDACLVDGERVSSSAIRRAVLRGDLRGAERLLGNPFRLDCSAFVPEGTSGGVPRGATDVAATAVTESAVVASVVVVAERAVLSQVIPPDGEYPVTAVGEDGSRSKALLSIGDRKLRLLSDMERVRMVEFVS